MFGGGEVIKNGDPLWDRLTRAWWAQKQPAQVTLGNTVYSYIGNPQGSEEFVPLRVLPQSGMEASYASQSMPGVANRALNPDGTPAKPKIE